MKDYEARKELESNIVFVFVVISLFFCLLMAFPATDIAIPIVIK